MERLPVDRGRSTLSVSCAGNERALTLSSAPGRTAIQSKGDAARRGGGSARPPCGRASTEREVAGDGGWAGGGGGQPPGADAALERAVEVVGGRVDEGGLAVAGGTGFLPCAARGQGAGGGLGDAWFSRGDRRSGGVTLRFASRLNGATTAG